MRQPHVAEVGERQRDDREREAEAAREREHRRRVRACALRRLLDDGDDRDGRGRDRRSARCSTCAAVKNDEVRASSAEMRAHDRGADDADEDRAPPAAAVGERDPDERDQRAEPGDRERVARASRRRRANASRDRAAELAEQRGRERDDGDRGGRGREVDRLLGRERRRAGARRPPVGAVGRGRALELGAQPRDRVAARAALRRPRRAAGTTHRKNGMSISPVRVRRRRRCAPARRRAARGRRTRRRAPGRRREAARCRRRARCRPRSVDRRRAHRVGRRREPDGRGPRARAACYGAGVARAIGGAQRWRSSPSATRHRRSR